MDVSRSERAACSIEVGRGRIARSAEIVGRWIFMLFSVPTPMLEATIEKHLAKGKKRTHGK